HPDPVVLWDVATKGQRRTFGQRCMSVALSGDGKLLAATGVDQDFYLWEADTGRLLHEERPPTNSHGYSPVTFSPDGKVVAVSIATGVFLYEGPTGKKVRELSKKPVRSLAFSPDGKLLAASGELESQFVLWDAATGKEIRRWEGDRGDVRVLAFWRDGKRLASGSSDTTILVWDVAGLLAE